VVLDRRHRFLQHQALASSSSRMVESDKDSKQAYQQLLTTQSITCWHCAEVRHPIHFFEQRVRCQHCGAERFVTTNKLACCRGGQLLLDSRLPDALVDMMTGNRTGVAPISAQACAQGISKCSRALNGLKAVTIEQMDCKDHTDSTHKDDGKRANSPRAQDKPSSSSTPEPN